MKNQQEYGPSPVAFLFGAGISIKAGMPSTKDLTQIILSGSQTTNKTASLLDRVLLLLKILKTEADTYYLNDRESNYEDLYFMLQQLLGSLTFRESNPIANFYTKHLEYQIGHLLQDTHSIAVSERDFPPLRRPQHKHDVSTVVKLLRECRNYLQDVVCSMLDEQCRKHEMAPGELKDFGWLAEAAGDGSSGQKIFFTLNYDTLLEQYFQSSEAKKLTGGLELNDAFPLPIGTQQNSYLEEELWKDTSAPQLVKLHGSLNWSFDDSIRLKKIFRQGEFELDKQVVLIGTHNKPTYYTNPLFEDLHVRFRDVLKKTSRMVVCGYGFGDRAINMRLFAWLNSNEKNRLLVVHPDNSPCKTFASSSAVHYLEQYQLKKQVRFYPKGMEDVKEWSEIRAELEIIDWLTLPTHQKVNI